MNPQYQLFWKTHDQIATANRHVMDMINCTENPLTLDDLHKLADRFPQRWEKYRHLLDAKP